MRANKVNKDMESRIEMKIIKDKVRKDRDRGPTGTGKERLLIRGTSIRR